MKKDTYIRPETKVAGTLRYDLLVVSYDVSDDDELGNEHGQYQDTDDENLEITSKSRESSDEEGEWGNLW